MTTDTGTELRTLSTTECWELLAGRGLGRVAWTAPDGPTVVPVNYGVAGRTLWIRTSAYAALVREADQSPVALEVDGADEASHAAWSVLVRGTAHVRFPSDGGATPPAVETWPAGPRPLWVVIDPREVTGRRLPPREG
ncbi:pyridoxamine 5'-phosphate oxidase family protein [Nocardioides sp. SOB77]|uniref:Pyridoxamine 5'-phosphate oxidase family protein n=1 Tax=Nocardioides oceani TaxID=3058369 RepID=A0ABT8FL96_9ACTN|nr:pyridoxamine 5'-phosphate oxidase family protein [Nocardioides oceani]MDN4175394.1 pyridoxamine 5'-phosphate oxidase family protein [Nocardioides oceani]